MRQETVTAAVLGHAVGDALGVLVELSLRNRLAEKRRLEFFGGM